MYGWIGLRELIWRERKMGMDFGGYICFVEDEVSFVMFGKFFGFI